MLGRSVLFVSLVVGATATASQIPDEFKNLRVLPEDIAKPELMDAMRHFSFALGVRCQHCHVGGDGVSFEGVDVRFELSADRMPY